MLNSIRIIKRIAVSERGSSLIEYSILLTFVAVLAVLFSPEHLPEYTEDGKGFTGQNISTTIYFIILKIKVILMHAFNSL